MYTIPVECYNCHTPYDTLSYIQYATFYDDVSFPYEEWRMCEVYAAIHPADPYFSATSAKDNLGYPVHTLVYNDTLDQKMLLLIKIRGIAMQHSNIRSKRYPMNICPHSGAPFGGYELCKIITRQYLYPNTPPKIFCVI